MKIIRVTYTVQPTYVEQNKQNIKQVMDDLKKLENPNTKYASYLEEDGITFMHFAQYPDEETSKILTTLPSFSKFRKELKESNPITPPKSMNLSLVGAGFKLFN